MVVMRRRGMDMAIQVGDQVRDPRFSDPRTGEVIEVIRNPACLMRTLVIQWADDLTVDELQEIEFGPLED